MTEQETQMLLNQLKGANIFEMIPGYKELPKVTKEAVLDVFKASIEKEKARLVNEQ